MKFKTLAIALICSAPMITLADAPTTRPLPARSGPGMGAGGRDRPAFRREMLGKDEPITQAEMDQTEQFMKENLPRRYELFAQLRPGTPARTAVLTFMTRRYRALLRAKDFDDEMYAQLLKEAQLEDQAIELVKALRSGDSQAESQLREKARPIVDLWLDGRKARIEKVEQALRIQKAQLEFDMEHKDARVDEKIKSLK